ncbi:acetyl-CoA carboxylase biotin carboxyl carrier protein [Chrysiogenes arsenatis]|uniref:acetyl-CoA carboxylase biotin carboxyl carrier protein n=1 Tax=Chrysiogenes arsenatis TaxID=309797 RepID=UPI00041FDAEA|nr:acetyl-CoA carboxylase biotin carboxyl carrier protein [Chrysiogenes arsenatis]
MHIDDIKALVAQVDASSISELKLEQETFKLTIRKGSLVAAQAAPAVAYVSAPAPAANTAIAPAPAAAPAATPDVNYAEVKSPIVGTFYAAPTPESSPYVAVGSKVKKGDVLCIVEAMKIMNEIESDVSGTVVKILGENSKPVEFGQTLFLIDEA